MADTSVTSVTPQPKRRRRWLKATGFILGILVVLLVVVYFVGTSGAFFKGVILPRVSKSINADVTVSDASISPFKQVVLKNLKVQTTGSEPLVTASEVRARYSLADILRGNLHVDEVTLLSPQIALIENADGTSNLDPLLKAKQEKPAAAKPSAPAKPSKPLQVDFRKLTLTDGTVRRVKNYSGGKSDVTELSKVNVTLEDLKNGQSGKLSLSSEVKADQNPPSGQAGSLQGKVNGNFAFAMSADLKPTSVKGNTHLDITQASGAMADFSALGGDLDCEITPTDIKQIALRFQRNNARLAEIRVAGPFDMEKTEGRLNVDVSSIDRQFLNLAGARQALDFGSTTINSTNQILLAKGGSSLTAAGRLNLNQFQITRTNQTSPPLDLHADYDVTVDKAAANAVLRSLAFSGNQKGRQVLSANLSSPMTLAWGDNAASAIGDSSLNFNVTDFDLADWKAFVGETAPAGIVNLKAKLLSQQAGKQLTFDLDAQINNLTVKAASNEISQAAVGLQAHGQATNMTQFKLADYKLQVTRQNQSLVSASGSGTYDQESGAADMLVALQASIPNLLNTLPQKELAVSSGAVELKAHVIQTKDKQTNATQTVTGNLALSDLTGKMGKNDFRRFGTTLNFDLLANPDQVQIRKLNGNITEAGNPGGSLDVSGSCAPKTKAAQITARLTDFNQNGLRTFLEPMLGDKKLTSIALNGTATTQCNPNGDSSIKADLQITNLVVTDPQNRFPATPLEARLQVDSSLSKQIADVRQVRLTLTPTPKAKNELTLQGRVDMTHTNAIEGNLQLAADSLDVTRYYDLFSGGKKTEPESTGKPASSRPAPEAAASTGGGEKEPEPVQLPFRNFTAGANIGRFYLREVEITNLQATVHIDGGHVVLDPFKLALNGAPATANADLDLGVRGYSYDVSLNLNSIPLAPLVNSFQPERKGKIGGTMTAQAKITGKGVTGASLQKNLAGQFDVGSTNLHLSVDNIENRLIRTIVEFVSVIPDLVNNPASAGTSLVQGLSGLKEGGLTSDLRKSPIDVIQARGTAGSGKIELQQSAIQSPVFRGEAVGTITLAPILTNSTLNLPVSLWLERGVAEKSRLLTADTPPDAKYAKLPDLLTIVGTLGDPKKKINKAGLVGGALKGISGIPGIGGKTGSALEGLGGLLTGQKPATNAPGTTTNTPPSKSLEKSLFDLLQKKK